MDIQIEKEMVAYYHEEWEGGSKGEYLMNGKTKGRRVGER